MRGDETYQKIEAFLATEHVDLTAFATFTEARRFNNLLRQIRSGLTEERYLMLEVGVGQTDGEDIIIRRGIDLQGKIYTDGVVTYGNRYYCPSFASGQSVVFSLCRWRSSNNTDYHLFRLAVPSSPRHLLELV